METGSFFNHGIKKTVSYLVLCSNQTLGWHPNAQFSNARQTVHEVLALAKFLFGSLNNAANMLDVKTSSVQDELYQKLRCWYLAAFPLQFAATAKKLVVRWQNSAQLSQLACVMNWGKAGSQFVIKKRL